MSYTCELACHFYHWTEPVARKKHQCVECSAPILKGEKHFYGRGKWEDIGIESYRQHLLCMEACMLIRDEIEGGECIPFGRLMDYCHEYSLDVRESAKKGHEPAKRLRSLLARIKWRERKEGL